MAHVMRRTLFAEWTKLWTVRSTVWSLVALLAGTIGLSALTSSSASTTGGSPGSPGDDDIVLLSLSGVYLGQIAIATLAVLAITSEFATGMIRTTFTAVPRRTTVLAAKAATVTAVTLAIVSPARWCRSSSGSRCCATAATYMRTAIRGRR